MWQCFFVFFCFFFFCCFVFFLKKMICVFLLCILFCLNPLIIFFSNLIFLHQQMGLCSKEIAVGHLHANTGWHEHHRICPFLPRAKHRILLVVRKTQLHQLDSSGKCASASANCIASFLLHIFLNMQITFSNNVIFF